MTDWLVSRSRVELFTGERMIVDKYELYTDNCG